MPSTLVCTGGCSGSAHCWPDAARFARHRVGDRWHVDETYVKLAGRWVYLYRAIDQFGQVIDVYATTRRHTEAARRFFQRARTTTGVAPLEIITDRAPTYPRVLDQLWPAAWHHTEQYANNRIESDHAQLKRWLRPRRGIKTMTGLRILASGHAFMQNLRRRHYEIATDEPAGRRLAIAFAEHQVAESGPSSRPQDNQRWVRTYTYLRTTMVALLIALGIAGQFSSGREALEPTTFCLASTQIP